ncbi:MAG: insulinase family protein, partial [bacterium]|nr:insulinase family protein [bacterium]
MRKSVHIIRLNAVLLFFCLCPGLWAQPDAGPQPDAGSGSIWKNRPEKIQVSDKLSFIFHRDTSSSLTVLRIFINGGKKAEPGDRQGLSFITTRLCIEIPNRANVKKLMEMGGAFSANVEGDFSLISVKCLSADLEGALKILTGILQNPLISTLRISHIKRFMKHQQKNEEDKAELLMTREYYNAFFKAGGYGGSIFGTAEPDSIKAIKKKNIRRFYDTFFNLSNMVIAVSSDLSRSKMEALLKKYVEPLPPGNGWAELPRGAPAKTVPTEKKEHFFQKDNTQTLVSLAVPLPAMSPRHYTCAYMLENLLGDGIGSKLWPLRAVKNLAYRLDARVIHMKDAGFLRIYLKTGNAKKEEVFEALKEVITTLYEKGVTGEEFRTLKVRSRAFFLRHNESRENRIHNLGFFECTGLGFGFLEAFFSHINSV